jgi:anaerobic magnesium-protoporphyrin IX monomethyl ester cyclase
MRILFLLTTIGCSVKAHHPTGFLSAFLKEAGHETSFVELDRIDPQLIDKSIQEFRPHVLAASSVMQQFKYVRAYINYVKKKYPHIHTVLGGTHAILKPNIIKETEGLDAICISEGELPLLEYVKSLECGNSTNNIPSMHIRSGQEIIKNPNTYAVTEEDMGTLPHQDRMIFPSFKNHKRSDPLIDPPRVLWGRGCPYACTYCSVPSLRKVFREPLRASKTSWVRFPPAEKAIEEIEILRDTWIFDKYIIDDDVFTTKKSWILEFANKYPSHLKDKLKYEANLRIESVDKEILLALKDTGCELLKFGLENGNYDIRRKILKRPISDEKIIQVFQWAHEVGIPAHTFNILGIPTETKETIWETIKLNRRIKPNKVQVTIFFPYYGTPLGDESIKKGLVSDAPDSYHVGESAKSSIQLENMTPKQVERYARWFKFLVYYPYSKRLAWSNFKAALNFPEGNVAKVVIKSLNDRGFKSTATKISNRFFSGNNKRPLQVETLGTDGERPHFSSGIQDLEDLLKAGVPSQQYDIEDWDTTAPHMDSKN